MRYRAVLFVLGLAAAFAGLAAAKEAFPTPSVIATTWELEFELQTPQSMTIRLPGEDKARTYWYMLYTVTNRTGADRVFVPSFTMYTETGQILRAGMGVPSALFQEVQKRHNNPLLIDMAAITGRLLQGEDNAKDGVAIWPDFDPAARRFDIFIGGLSGERVSLDLPVPVKGVDAKGKTISKTKVVLTKTMQLTYFLPGEAAARVRTAPRLTGKQWVMR